LSTRKINNKNIGGMNKIQKFFWWCSGANQEILKNYPTEHSKYFGLGGTVFFTAAMAGLAGGYALFTAFESSVLAVGFGVFWGLLILNLDRYIVSTTGSGEGEEKWWSKYLRASPRIIMAMFIGFVIAIPLELKIFDKEIQLEIANMQEEKMKMNLKNSSSILLGVASESVSSIERKKQETESQMKSGIIPPHLSTRKSGLEKRLSDLRIKLNDASAKRNNWNYRFNIEAKKESPNSVALARYAKNRDDYYSEIRRFSHNIDLINQQLDRVNNE